MGWGACVRVEHAEGMERGLAGEGVASGGELAGAEGFDVEGGDPGVTEGGSFFHGNRR